MEGSSCSCSKDTDCHHKAAEFACSACLFCVACPLCIVWCCVKLPCKIGWKAAKNVRHWICCGSQEKVDLMAVLGLQDIGLHIEDCNVEGLLQAETYKLPI
ncbi:conserved hypothetical protein [Ricinus communis]|uniref:Uncharacterized protein n=1 Tax=Ricinus communis TaxID=3988 RepID=B9SFW9_RICCO|nr:conserved hypothetical protein [Ricinus communis]